MSGASFRDEAGRARIKRAVADIEAQTCAEVVVAVHPASSGYAGASWLAGTVLAGAWLLVFLYHPEPFDFTYLPLEIAGWYLLGFFVARTIPAVKRALTRKKTRAFEVDRAGKVAFIDLGITKTRARSGLLVFVSLLEREVRILRDVGVAQHDIIPGLSSRLAESVRRDDVEAFAVTLAELGPALAVPMPRGEGDENELPDAPEEAA
jgi:putative membrane protein